MLSVTASWCITYRKPRDQALLSLLREFLYLVVTKKFFPVIRKIGTTENEIADHISRRFDEDAASDVFAKFGLKDMRRITPKTTFFNLSANWWSFIVSAQWELLMAQNMDTQGYRFAKSTRINVKSQIIRPRPREARHLFGFIIFFLIGL